MREVVAEAENRHALFDWQRFLGYVTPGYESILSAKPPFPIMHIDTMWKFLK